MGAGQDPAPLAGLASLQRQFGSALAGLMRPGTYFGAARESLTALVQTMTHPLGLVSVEALQDALEAERAVDVIDRQAPNATTDMPVILVHGYIMNRSAFLVMSQALAAAGFRHVRAFNYPQFTLGLPEIARLLGKEVDRVLAATGASRCMIIGHSLGGMIARYYIQMIGGEDKVDTLVTLGTPHNGTYTAHLGIGPAAAQMTYRSPIVERLEQAARPSSVRYICYYSDLDVFVVPAVSAKLSVSALQAVNIRIHDIGHLSMLLSGEVIQSVVDHLSHPDRFRPNVVSQDGQAETSSAKLEISSRLSEAFRTRSPATLR